ncbi:hypothetical protein QR685DRAFT_594145 [Neurospora intermedia]|uniref:Secreted protein n=1 Tax=Neurospora intermedia TaxID=5142 RepID=A0ABR3DSK4_NEUIN
MNGTTGEAKAYILMLFILYALEFRDAHEGAGSRSFTTPVARDQRSKVRIGEQVNRPTCHSTCFNGEVATSRGGMSPTWYGVWLYLVSSTSVASAVTPFVHVVYRDPSRAPRRQKDSSGHSSAHPSSARG